MQLEPSARGFSSLLGLGLAIVVLATAVAVAAPLLAPYDPHEQLDPAAGHYRPPLARLEAVRLSGDRWLLATRVERTTGGLVVERLGERRTLAAAEVLNLRGDGVADHRFYLLGSDQFGRDIWSRVLYGARVSLAIGLAAVALAATLGVLVGGLAGAAGGIVDLAVMRLVDGALAFPRLFLVIALAAIFPHSELLLVAVLGGTGWMSLSRQVRSQIASLKRREFALAARAVGQRPAIVFLRHLLPNALTPVTVDASLRIADVILVEAALSFLGLGVQAPTPSWGNMIADGRNVLTTAWWVAAFPGLAIAVTVMGFNLIGDGLRDALAPRRDAPRR